MASKFQSINNFLKIINIFDRMKLLHKSLLDLVPLSIVTILIAIFASYGLNSLNNDFDKLLSKEAKIGAELRSARQALVNWKASVLGLVVATEQNIEAVEVELRQLKDANAKFNELIQKAQRVVFLNKEEFVKTGKDKWDQGSNSFSKIDEAVLLNNKISSITNQILSLSISAQKSGMDLKQLGMYLMIQMVKLSLEDVQKLNKYNNYLIRLGGFVSTMQNMQNQIFSGTLDRKKRIRTVTKTQSRTIIIKKEINDLIDFEQSSFEDYSKSKSVSDNNKTFLLQPMIELETSSKILSEFEKYNKNLLTALEEAKNDWSSKLTELSNDWTSQYELINHLLP